jgi:hypothetical protein
LRTLGQAFGGGKAADEKDIICPRHAVSPNRISVQTETDFRMGLILWI